MWLCGPLQNKKGDDILKIINNFPNNLWSAIGWIQRDGPTQNMPLDEL